MADAVKCVHCKTEHLYIYYITINKNLLLNKEHFQSNRLWRRNPLLGMLARAEILPQRESHFEWVVQCTWYGSICVASLYYTENIIGSGTSSMLTAHAYGSIVISCMAISEKVIPVYILKLKSSRAGIILSSVGSGKNATNCARQTSHGLENNQLGSNRYVSKSMSSKISVELSSRDAQYKNRA